MSFASLIKYYASDTEDAIDKFVDTAVSGGWTIHDDLTGETPYSYVITSSGITGEEWPMYLKLDAQSNKIDILSYVYWDNSTHTGNIKMQYNAYSYIDTYSSSSFYIWCSASENGVVLDTYVSSQHRTAFVSLLNSYDPVAALGVTQSGVSAGSDVVLQLGSGEADRFVAGTSYQIFDTENRNWVEVNSVDVGTDQITITTLSYDFSAGSRIGVLPYRWCIFRNQFAFVLTYDTDGPADQPNYQYGGYNNNIFNRNYIDPDPRTQKYPMTPFLVYGYNNTSIEGYVPVNQYTNWMRCYLTTAHELPMSVGNLDTGTSTGSNTSVTLNDTSKSWTTNAYVDKVLIITGGMGSGQFRKISSNTGTELTISTAFDTLPTDTSEYTICNEGWQYLYSFNNAEYSGAMRVL
jgi:hypothetical protein